jgi:hypothetical protein
MRTVEVEMNMRNWMLKNWGKRCDVYNRGCALCNAWKAFDFLFHPDKYDMVK